MAAVWFAAGLGLGCVAGCVAWLFARRAREADRAAFAARLEEREARLREAQQQIDAVARREQVLRDDLRAEAERRAGVQAELRAGEEKLRLLQEGRAQLLESFQALAAEALKSNREDFLHQARLSMEKFQEGARGDLDQRQKAIAEVVAPVSEKLAELGGKVQEMEKTRFGAYSALFQQVKSLHEETGRLANAFRAPPQRGRWAELHLRRAVELAGLSDHCDFYEQVTVSAEGSAMRPDMVIKLAGGRTVLVDAKAPFAAYVEAGEATDDATRVARLRDHAAQVRQHVTLLSRKSYWEHFDESAELIILYLPSDALFVAALDHDRELLETALRQRVVLATPSTLLALLLTVAHGWKQEKMEMNAREIANLGRDLHKRISDTAKHLGRLGKLIDGTVRAYNEAVGSLEARVLPGARRFKELQAANVDVEIEPLVPVESAPRPLTAPELSAREVPDDAN